MLPKSIVSYNLVLNEFKYKIGDVESALPIVMHAWSVGRHLDASTVDDWHNLTSLVPLYWPKQHDKKETHPPLELMLNWTIYLNALIEPAELKQCPMTSRYEGLLFKIQIQNAIRKNVTAKRNWSKKLFVTDSEKTHIMCIWNVDMLNTRTKRWMIASYSKPYIRCLSFILTKKKLFHETDATHIENGNQRNLFNSNITKRVPDFTIS